MRKLLLFVALLCLIGLALSSCAARAHNIDRFEWWTRYYETRMGLVESRVYFGATPNGKCGEVWMEPQIGEDLVFVVATYYDPEMEGCRAPWDVALHEACHRRLQHHLAGHQLEQAGIDIEEEVKECERWYRSDVYSGSGTRGSRPASRTARTRR